MKVLLQNTTQNILVKTPPYEFSKNYYSNAML